MRTLDYIVYVSHDMRRMKTFFQKIIVCDDGEMVLEARSVALDLSIVLDENYPRVVHYDKARGRCLVIIS